MQISSNYVMEELDSDCEIESYIASNLSKLGFSAIGMSRKWFDCAKFHSMLCNPSDDDMVHRILDRFEDLDLSAAETCSETCLEDEEEEEFAGLFLENPTVGTGWLLLKKRHKYPSLWPIINFWWKEAGRNQHAENGRGRVRCREEFEEEFSSV